MTDLFEMFGSDEAKARDARIFSVGPKFKPGTIGAQTEFVGELLDALIRSGRYGNSPEGLCRIEAGGQRDLLETPEDVVAALAETHGEWQYDPEQIVMLMAESRHRSRRLRSARRYWRALQALEQAERQMRASPAYAGFRYTETWRNGYLAGFLAKQG